MAVDQRLLDILICPKCRGSLTSVEGGRSLLCAECQLKYPIRDDVPVMIVEEAMNQRETVPEQSGNLPNRQFKIVAGPNKEMMFRLEMGTCKVIGRSAADPNKTNMFHVSISLALDEGTKDLIRQYVSRQFRKTSSVTAPDSDLGDFRRTADVILDDPSISRLHAMLFYDSAGVGVLDLVSKNGTFVNGDEVESRLLKKGDAIEVGESKILFEG